MYRSPVLRAIMAHRQAFLSQHALDRAQQATTVIELATLLQYFLGTCTRDTHTTLLSV